MEKSEKILSEARAKIIWGHPVEESIELLMNNGFERRRAEEQIGIFINERAKDIRSQGISDTLKGVGLLILSAIIVAVLYSDGTPRFRRLTLPGLIAVFGVWKLIQGFHRITGGAKIKGSVSDLE